MPRSGCQHTTFFRYHTEDAKYWACTRCGWLFEDHDVPVPSNVEYGDLLFGYVKGLGSVGSEED